MNGPATATTTQPAAPGAVSARRVGLDVFVQLATNVANLALGVVVTALIARTLGERGFGQWTTIFAIGAFTGFFTNLGLREVVVRQIAGEPEREAEWLGAQVKLVAALAVPAAAATAGVVLLLARSDQMKVAGVLLALLSLQAPAAALSAVFQMRVRNDIVVGIQFANGVLWAVAVAVIYATQGRMVALALCFLAVNFATTAVTVLLAARVVPVRLRGISHGWLPLLKLAAPAAVSAFLVLTYVRIDQVLVYALAGSREAGLYGAVYRILDQAQFVPIALMTTLLPIIADAYDRDRERLRRLLPTVANYLAMCSFGALALALAAAGPIIRLVFGADFSHAAAALPILMGAFVSICFGYLAGNLVIVLRLQGRTMRYALIGLVLNLALNAVLIPPYGFVAAAWVTLATEVTVMTLSARLVLSELHVSLRVGRLVRTAAAAAAMAGLVLGLRGAGAPVGALLAAAAVAYPALLLGVRAVSLRELGALLRRESPA